MLGIYRIFKGINYRTLSNLETAISHFRDRSRDVDLYQISKATHLNWDVCVCFYISFGFFFINFWWHFLLSQKWNQKWFKSSLKLFHQKSQILFNSWKCSFIVLKANWYGDLEKYLGRPFYSLDMKLYPWNWVKLLLLLYE